MSVGGEWERKGSCGGRCTEKEYEQGECATLGNAFGCLRGKFCCRHFDVLNWFDGEELFVGYAMMQWLVELRVRGYGCE